VRIGVLGPLEVRDDAGALVPVGGARLRSLLIRLAIGDGRPISVERLAGDLWADDAPADAANAVQALVSRLRGVLGRDAIEHGPAGYRLAADPGQVDARAFEQLVGRARGVLADGDPVAGAALLTQALGLWRGPALADVADAPFAAAPITRLSELRLGALEDRVEAELALGRGAGLVPELQELAAAHPLRERLRGQLMRALQAAGRQADALAAYEDTRRVLADQLGVDPSADLAAVHLAILRGEQTPAGPGNGQGPGWADGAQPRTGTRSRAGLSGPGQPSSLVPDRSNLPAQLTSFVGREEEMGRLGKLLGESRLVTLTGPGGAGKTRLSVEASGRLAGELADGVWFVPLAPVRDALDVPQAVLTAIGVQDAGWLDPAEAARLAALAPADRLADVLARRELLLVLDNCEHLVDAVARLAGQVLSRAPAVRILATSREPLGITGETLCPVPSLELPPEESGAEEAARFAAVALFTDRASAVRPGFTVDHATAGPVVRICRALDGIPLAIELAAARLRALTPAQVADRLDDRFGLLSMGSRTALPRHQTLRAIVDWSWELLDEPERVALRRLSVFRGGATPESAEAVCALDGDRGPVVDLVAALVDKSLVTATGEQEVRYHLLETVRAYAADRLAEAGEQDAARGAHAGYFVALAERAEPELRARDQVLWLNRLSAEHDNCAAALRFAIDGGDVPLALRLLGALTFFWMMRDYDAEAREWAAAIEAIAGDSAPPGLRDAYALCRMMAMLASQTSEEFTGVGSIQEMMDVLLPLTEGSSHPMVALGRSMAPILTGDVDGARRGLAGLADRPDPWLRAAARMLSGQLELNVGHVDLAAEELEAGWAAFREIGDRTGLIITLTGLAEVAMARAQPDEAVRLLEQARGYAAEGLAMNLGEMLRVPLARARMRTGDLAGARADLEYAVSLAGRIGEHDDEAAAYVELGDLARREGDLAGAGRLLARAQAVVEPRAASPGMQGAAAAVYTALGGLAAQQGDLAGAAEWHARALAALTGPGLMPMTPNPALAGAVEGIAALAAARGEAEKAAELLGLAATLRGYSNDFSLEVARTRSALAEALSEEDLAAAYARGRAQGRDEALALIP
jgi:predicted ATPase/DNA-binding SARP family transcriptional activator